jgi:hypothetical protein
MATTEQLFSLQRKSESIWVAVPIIRQPETLDDATNDREPLLHINQKVDDSEIPFAKASKAGAVLSERFPHLAIALIALVMFAVSVTAEIEYLRQSGYTFGR